MCVHERTQLFTVLLLVAFRVDVSLRRRISRILHANRNLIVISTSTFTHPFVAVLQGAVGPAEVHWTVAWCVYC